MVRFGKSKAFLRAGVWISADITLERTLNRATRRWISHSGGPKLGDPGQELAVAKEMAAKFDGRQALHVRSTAEESEDTFVPHRQMEFEFTGFISGNSRRSTG